MGILDKALMDPAVEDAIAAENEVVEKLSGWQKDKNNADENAIAERKRMRDIAAAVAVQKTVEAGGVTAQFSLDSTGRELSEDQFDSNQAKNVDNLNPTADPDIRYATDNLGLPVGHYDYSKSFAEQIEDYKNGLIPKGDTLVVGATPEVFRKIGLSALPMTINTTHVDYALNGTKDFDHQLGESLLKQLPTAIKHPVAIMTSETKTGSSIVAMLEIRHNGKQVVTPVVIDGFGKQNGVIIDSNAITSIYGKNYSISKVLRDAIEQEANGQFRLFYLNKNKATRLLQEARVPMPKNPATHDGGFIHTLADPRSPVKSKIFAQIDTQQFKRWFGRSIVRNADGTPKKVYHGTVSNFTVFERGDIGYHVGTKEQAEDRIAGAADGHIMELYAAIQKPLRAAFDFGDWHGQSVAQMLMETEQFEDFDNRAEIEERLSEIAQMDNQQEADTALRKYLQSLGYDGIVYENNWEGAGDSFIAFEPVQLKSATDNIGLFDRQNNDIRYAIDTDLLRETVTAIDTEALETKLLSLNDAKSLKGMGIWLKEPSRIFDAIAGGDRELRNNLHEIFEKPHSDATGRYAGNIRKMQARVEQIALDAGAVTIGKKGLTLTKENRKHLLVGGRRKAEPFS